MTEVAAVQIIQPTNAAGGRHNAPRAGESRDLVVARADAFARRPMFAHSGSATAAGRPMVSAPFLAQHLDQAGVGRDAPVDARRAAQAYSRPTVAPAPRRDLAQAA